ncbi:carbohydrate ABC transporter permease [Thermaerobacter litoralis]
MPREVQRRLADTLTYFVLAFGGAFVLVPLLWMISTSLKGRDQLYVYPPQWIPSPVRWENYVEVWTTLPFARFFLNSLFITILATVAEVASVAVVAYGFARFNFRGRHFLFMLMLSTMMLPSVIGMIPTFLIWRELGRLDTFTPLTAPAWFAWGPASVFMLRQFLLSLPRDFEDAAVLDGAGPLQVLRHVVLPMVRPALLVIALLAFQGNWTNFMAPLLYLNTPDKFPVTLGLKFLETSLGPGSEAPMWNLMMVVSLLVALPILVLYALAQRAFIEGIRLGGTKG